MLHLVLWITVALVGILVACGVIWALLGTATKRSVYSAFVGDNSDAGLTLTIQSADGEVLLQKSANGLLPTDPFAAASVSKLFTHAVIFRLIDDGVLAYDGTLGELLPPTELSGLHVIGGVDRSAQITVRHLIDSTSGLPDYETERQVGGGVLFDQILAADRAVTDEEALDIVRGLPASFEPGDDGKARYSNTNALLLGRIAEQATGRDLADLLAEFVIDRARLAMTHPARHDSAYAAIHVRGAPVARPAYIASSLATGGIITTGADLARFTRAFFQGDLFDPAHVSDPVWRPIQHRPLDYGAGMMGLEMNRLLSPFFPAPRIAGHSGSTGSFAFHVPSLDLYVTGTTNQVGTQPFPLIYAFLDTIR